KPSWTRFPRPTRCRRGLSELRPWLLLRGATARANRHRLLGGFLSLTCCGDIDQREDGAPDHHHRCVELRPPRLQTVLLAKLVDGPGRYAPRLNLLDLGGVERLPLVQLGEGEPQVVVRPTEALIPDDLARVVVGDQPEKRA